MKRWLYVIIPAAILFVLIGARLLSKWRENAAFAAMQAARAKTPPLVAVVPAAVRNLVATYNAVGNVEAILDVKIASKVAGRIEYLNVNEGDRVKAGLVLVKVDPSEVNALVRQKQAALAEAQYRLAQAEITQNPTNVAVTTAVKQQNAGLLSSKADYNQTTQNYSAQLAAAEALIEDAQGKVANTQAAITSAQAGVSSAQANLANAKSKYDRITSLYKQGFIAAQDVDDARTAVAVQQGALEVAQGQLKSVSAQHDSALAQQKAALKQAQIVKNTGRADIESARAKVTQAQAALEYAQANVAQQTAYKQNIAALRASMAAARADLRAAQAQRADTVLRSPLDGSVTARYMDPGAMAIPGQPILAVQAIRQVWISIPITEEVMGRAHLGMLADVRLDGIPGRTFSGKIVQLNPSADPSSRQFNARVLLDNPRSLIKPGMFARISLTIDQAPNAIVVPREAVQKDKDGSFVITVGKDGMAHHQPVKLGMHSAADISVLNGVRPGQRVVVLSGSLIRDGQKVRVDERRPEGNRSPGGKQPES